MMSAKTHGRRSSLGNSISINSTDKKRNGTNICHHNHKHNNHHHREGLHNASSRRGSQHSTMSSGGGGLIASSTMAVIAATTGTVHKKLSTASLVNTRAFWPYPSAVAIAAAMGAGGSGVSASGIGGHECQSPAACASSLELEALAAVHRLSVAVRDISVSEMLPRTSQLIFVNVTTLEGQPYCLELTHKGWRVTSLRSDCMQGDFTRMELFTTYYGSIYDLMSVISPAYKRHLIQWNVSSNADATGASGDNQSSATSAASSDAATPDAAATVDNRNECGPVEQLVLTDEDLSAATAVAAAECVCGDIMTAAAAAALHHAPLCRGCCSSVDRAGAAVAIRNALATVVRRHSLTPGTADDGCGRTAVDALLNERLRLMERYGGVDNAANDDAAENEDEEDVAEDSSAASTNSSAVVETNRRRHKKAATRTTSSSPSANDNNTFSSSSASRSVVMYE